MSDPLIAYAKYTTSEAEAAIAHASTEFKPSFTEKKDIRRPENTQNYISTGSYLRCYHGA